MIDRIVNVVVLVFLFFLWGINMVIMEDVMVKMGLMFVVFVWLIFGGFGIIVFVR